MPEDSEAALLVACEQLRESRLAIGRRRESIELLGQRTVLHKKRTEILLDATR